MTLLEKIKNLTWFNLVEKLKDILQGMYGSIGNFFLQEGTNITITGVGSEVDPYIISASGGGGTPDLELYSETGTRAGADGVAIIGDYDDSGNGTKLIVNDANGGSSFSGYLASENGGIYIDNETLQVSGFQKVVTITEANVRVDEYIASTLNSTNYKANKIEFLLPNVIPANSTGGVLLFPTMDTYTTEETIATQEYVNLEKDFILLKSPNETVWRIEVSDVGAITATEV